jgi:hypothetical protein
MSGKLPEGGRGGICPTGEFRSPVIRELPSVALIERLSRLDAAGRRPANMCVITTSRLLESLAVVMA